MPAKVILTVAEGALTGQTFVFTERTTCLIGRAEDCDPRLPDDQDHHTISRHHCLLDINPPDIRIRDFGSLNGTTVNGTIIGQRQHGQNPEDVDHAVFREYDLQEGDEIKLGKTVFRVSLSVPPSCTECHTEIPEDQRAGTERAPGVFQCADCQRKAALAHRPASPQPKPGVCASCGRDVTRELDRHRHGEFLCATCRADPGRLVQGLLALANQGDPDLAALAGYRLVRELGRGGMGTVSLLEQEQSGEQVALKLMLPQIAADARAKALFLREAEATQALHHPNVVQLFHSGSAHGVFFFTLEYCAGGSLRNLLEQRGDTLPQQEAVEMILQALDGLQYAHEQGFVHRDVKPANLFLTEAGPARLVKVGDYGLAKAFDTAGLSGQTRTGAVSGTPVFMPRQQVINFKYAKPEVDVWALAASLYQALTGVFPREFPRGRDPWMQVLQSDAVPIRQRNPAIPKPLAQVIDQALKDRPEIGFKSARAFKEALEGVI